jgi:hypothetical protein
MKSRTSNDQFCNATTDAPATIPTLDLERVQGGKLPPGIDEAMAEGEREAQRRRRQQNN